MQKIKWFLAFLLFLGCAPLDQDPASATQADRLRPFVFTVAAGGLPPRLVPTPEDHFVIQRGVFCAGTDHVAVPSVRQSPTPPSPWRRFEAGSIYGSANETSEAWELTATEFVSLLDLRDQSLNPAEPSYYPEYLWEEGGRRLGFFFSFLNSELTYAGWQRPSPWQRTITPHHVRIATLLARDGTPCREEVFVYCLPAQAGVNWTVSADPAQAYWRGAHLAWAPGEGYYPLFGFAFYDRELNATTPRNPLGARTIRLHRSLVTPNAWQCDNLASHP